MKSYYESEFEAAFIKLLEAEGWVYTFGENIHRKNLKEVLLEEDFKNFLAINNQNLCEEDINQIFDNIRLFGAESDFATLHKIYYFMSNAYSFKPKNSNSQMINLIDFENPSNNIFRAVNQFTVEYSNNGQTKNRRPDILLFVNGMPLCIIELKNPADEQATLYDAFKQITVRYWRDIPHLLHYCPLSCISDGAKTKLGTIRTPYQHFYSWRRVNDGDDISKVPFKETEDMIKGVLSPARFLEIFRDYILFQDSEYDSDETAIVCRYPQFFAVKRLKESIINAINKKDGKGGTYFGATGCGKTYAMAFLARQLSLRYSSIIGSPTIILIVDRDDLQEQGAELFTKCKEFLLSGEVSIIENRKDLKEKLEKRESGGFFICTIQKFCDREDDKIGLINSRENIICFSDEAHRTQIEKAREIKFTKDSNENMKAMLSKPYAKVLREAFPNATFVGFTGTPIDETYQTFGAEIDRYTMDMAVADGITVPIKYHPRISKVLLDNNKVKDIEDYYKKCYKDGATEEDIEASRKAMSSMKVIISEPLRLERLAIDIHNHYISSCNADPKRVQKAMIVCLDRQVAYTLLQIFKSKYPEWFIEKKIPENIDATSEELKELENMPFIAMVSTVNSNDEKSMYNYLGGSNNNSRSKKLAKAFKQEKSNFHIAIVVDMWITGFDVPTLTYLYNDKPLQNHLLIQTISRVNRVYSKKEYGMIVDYIGICDKMQEAIKKYGGTTSIAPSADDAVQARDIFREKLKDLKNLFANCNLNSYLEAENNSVEKYALLSKAAEFVFTNNQELETENGKAVSFKIYFLKVVKQMKKAFDVCYPAGNLENEETSLALCFMAIAGLVRKMNGTSEIDADAMNIAVSKMVEEALKYNKVESILEIGEEEENIFSEGYLEKLSDIKMPATKFELLIKMLKKEIKEYEKTNQLAAKTFKEMLEKTIEEYHKRRKNLSENEANIAQEQASEDIIKVATNQALEILEKLKKSKESFRKIGLTFEQKAFYDILIALRNEYNFEYGIDEKVNGIEINDKCKSLAQKIKEIIDTKSKFADWLNNQNVRNQLKLDIKICLIKNGYPPKYTPKAFEKLMQQVENFKENTCKNYNIKENLYLDRMVAENVSSKLA